MAGMWSNQSIIPTFDVSAKPAEPKMAFNFAHLLSAACGGAARRLRALRARFFSLFLSFSLCNFTEKMPIFGLALLKNDVKRPLAASTRRAPGRSPLRRAARARVARASDRHRSPLRALCPRTADAQARGRARAVALRTPPSTRARSRSSRMTLYSE